MPLWTEIVVALLVAVGGFFLLVGSLALAKLPDTMRRLHGPTKATTLGIGALLLASMLHFTVQRGGLSVHELLITLFLVLTAPVSAFMLARVHLLDAGTVRQVPPSARPHDVAGSAEAAREPIRTESPGGSQS